MMSIATIKESSLSAIGNAIRELDGSSNTYYPRQMPQAYLNATAREITTAGVDSIKEGKTGYSISDSSEVINSLITGIGFSPVIDMALCCAHTSYNNSSTYTDMNPTCSNIITLSHSGSNRTVAILKPCAIRFSISAGKSSTVVKNSTENFTVDDDNQPIVWCVAGDSLIFSLGSSGMSMAMLIIHS